MDKEQNPNDILSGYMFWRLPNFEAMRNPEQFAKSIRFALNKYKSLYPNFFADSSNNVIYPYEDITKSYSPFSYTVSMNLLIALSATLATVKMILHDFFVSGFHLILSFTFCLIMQP